jgi:hypothetical protein
MKTGNLKIRAITNDALAEDLRKALLALRGVQRATVHIGRPGGAEVEYDETTTSLEHLVGRLRKGGFDAEIGGYSAGGAP